MNTSVSKPPVEEALATTLLANLAAFQAFARKRLRDDHMAADAVQEGLLRALKGAPRLSHDENLVAWFYRILRNVLADLHRRQTRETEKLAIFAADPGENDAELETLACKCVHGLLPALPPQHGRAIAAVDLEGKEAALAAAELGISRNLLKVRLHRARKQLRARLEETCQRCATHGCLDCTCDHQEELQ